jgi:hypothetical protein
LLLAARGVQVLGDVARRAGARPGVAGLAAALPVVAMTLYATLYYLPRQVERRTQYVAYPFGLRFDLPFVATSVRGPEMTGVDAPALVLTRDWWTFSTMLAPLNCAALDAARIDVCPVLFAVAATDEDAALLKQQYAESGRRVYWARPGSGVLRLEPDAAGAGSSGVRG